MKKKVFSLILAALVFGSLFSGCSSKNNKALTNNKNNTVSEVKMNTAVGLSQNDLIYFVMTDRFYDGDKSNDKDVNVDDPKAYHGGDIKGIIDKLDYIKSLGTTAIWITPVVENMPGGYHGYWTKDFYKVDPHLGDMQDMKNLVTEAHKRNMKILMDYVVNHVGYDNPWFTDGKHKDWFHAQADIQNYDDPTECENGWLSGLPDLNQDNPEVSDYLIKNAIWWVDNTGIDGMRLDTVRHVPVTFWTKFTKAIKQKYPNFYFLGEVWNDDTSYCEKYHEAGIDGITDYNLFDGLKETFKENGSTSTLVSAIGNEVNFKNPELNGIFIDNHDNKRFVTNAGKNGDKYLKLALAFELTYPSIPVIYYGTEIGMEGGDDPDNRQDMWWNNAKKSAILDSYKKLVEIRNSAAALKTKDIKILDYQADYITYQRGTGKNSVIVAFNISDKPVQITINVNGISDKFSSLVTKNNYKADNNKLKITVKPMDFDLIQGN